jgi:hypothetical protein
MVIESEGIQMRRCYTRLVVADCQQSKIKGIRAVVDEVMECRNDVEGVVSEGEIWLCGGRTPEDWAKSLTYEIWKVNGEFCDVVVTISEPIQYELTDRHYAEFLANQPEERNTDGNIGSEADRLSDEMDG